MSTEVCPTCDGWCCRDGSEMHNTHRNTRYAKHVCPDCTNGTEPPMWTAEQERTAVVAWLRGDAGFRMVPGNMAYCDYYADAIERGEHCREETE